MQVQEELEVVAGWQTTEQPAEKAEPLTERVEVWRDHGEVKVPARTKMKTVRDRAKTMLLQGGVFRVLDAEAHRAFRATPVRRDPELVLEEVTGP